MCVWDWAADLIGPGGHGVHSVATAAFSFLPSDASVLRRFCGSGSARCNAFLALAQIGDNTPVPSSSIPFPSLSWWWLVAHVHRALLTGWRRAVPFRSTRVEAFDGVEARQKQLLLDVCRWVRCSQHGLGGPDLGIRNVRWRKMAKGKWQEDAALLFPTQTAHMSREFSWFGGSMRYVRVHISPSKFVSLVLTGDFDRGMIRGLIGNKSNRIAHVEPTDFE